MNLNQKLGQEFKTTCAVEAWLWKNPVAMKAVQKGLKDSAEGKLVERGSFAQYADEAEEADG